MVLRMENCLDGWLFCVSRKRSNAFEQVKSNANSLPRALTELIKTDHCDVLLNSVGRVSNPSIHHDAHRKQDCNELLSNAFYFNTDRRFVIQSVRGNQEGQPQSMHL